MIEQSPCPIKGDVFAHLPDHDFFVKCEPRLCITASIDAHPPEKPALSQFAITSQDVTRFWTFVATPDGIDEAFPAHRRCCIIHLEQHRNCIDNPRGFLSIGVAVTVVRSVELKCRGVAQPGSAPALGAGGRWFESSRPDHRRQ
jgi:hypothetical protein